jgi:hypothetical protein
MNREHLLEELFDLNPICKSRGYWTTKEDVDIPIDKISDFHLKNIVNLLKRTRQRNIELAQMEVARIWSSCFSMYENPYSMYPDEQEHWDTGEHDDWGDRD